MGRCPPGREEWAGRARQRGQGAASTRAQRHKTRSVSWTANTSLCGSSGGGEGEAARDGAGAMARGPGWLSTTPHTLKPTWTPSNSEAMKGLMELKREDSLPCGTAENSLEDDKMKQEGSLEMNTELAPKGKTGRLQRWGR